MHNNWRILISLMRCFANASRSLPLREINTPFNIHITYSVYWVRMQFKENKMSAKEEASSLSSSIGNSSAFIVQLRSWLINQSERHTQFYANTISFDDFQWYLWESYFFDRGTFTEFLWSTHFKQYNWNEMVLVRDRSFAH